MSHAVEKFPGIRFKGVEVGEGGLEVVFRGGDLRDRVYRWVLGIGFIGGVGRIVLRIKEFGDYVFEV